MLVSIVGGNMINQNNRRIFEQDEYDFYDAKAKKTWNYVCSVTGWRNQKIVEDFKEDAICLIDNVHYYTELQVVGYWHNFGMQLHNDSYRFTYMYIAASKVNDLKKKVLELDSTVVGKLVFFNCVPNEMLTFDVDDLDESMIQERYGELTYVIPIATTKHRYITIKNIVDQGFDFPKCDCKDFHSEILSKKESRIKFEAIEENIRGFNGICCR